MPVYDEPMIYYPLSVLMLAGIREILLISPHSDLPHFKRLLGDGTQWGASFSYARNSPALRGWPKRTSSALILSEGGLQRSSWETIFTMATAWQGYWRRDELAPPEQPSSPITSTILIVTGLSSLTNRAPLFRIKEKPAAPRSNWAVTGLYFCDEHAAEIAANLKPSARGELEIADLLRAYLLRGNLEVRRMGRGFAWFDMGTHDSLMEASAFVQTLEKGQGLLIACPEEIAYQQAFITNEEFVRLQGKN